MKIKALFVLMAVLFSLTVPVLSVFAESKDNESVPQEYSYDVIITYTAGRGASKVTHTKSYTVTTYSASEAESKATKMWESENSSYIRSGYIVFLHANASRSKA